MDADIVDQIASIVSNPCVCQRTHRDYQEHVKTATYWYTPSGMPLTSERMDKLCDDIKNILELLNVGVFTLSDSTRDKIAVTPNELLAKLPPITGIPENVTMREDNESAGADVATKYIRLLQLLIIAQHGEYPYKIKYTISMEDNSKDPTAITILLWVNNPNYPDNEFESEVTGRSSTHSFRILSITR